MQTVSQQHPAISNSAALTHAVWKKVHPATGCLPRCNQVRKPNLV